jgi:DNA polymerase-3 subunit delta
MRLTESRIAAFLAEPDPSIRAVLVYGPDQGLVRERVDAITTTVAGRAEDPFRVTVLDAETVRSDPARLADEVAALSFTPGRRVVHVRDASDGLLEAVRAVLSQRTGDALLILEAGALPKRSSLRLLLETATDGAALPCYLDEGEALLRVIRDTLASWRLGVTPEALDYLVANLGVDRGVTRSELEKLAIYMGGDHPGVVGVEDAMACVGDNGAASLDGVVFTAFGGDSAALDQTLMRAYAEGHSPVAVVRAAIGHLLRLQLARALVAAGKPAKQAMAALKPAVFFKYQGSFQSQMAGWSDDRLTTALDIMLAAEVDCKTTGLPADAVCQRALFRIASAAAGRRLS